MATDEAVIISLVGTKQILRRFQPPHSVAAVRDGLEKQIGKGDVQDSKGLVLRGDYQLLSGSYFFAPHDEEAAYKLLVAANSKRLDRLRRDAQLCSQTISQRKRKLAELSASEPDELFSRPNWHCLPWFGLTSRDKRFKFTSARGQVIVMGRKSIPWLRRVLVDLINGTLRSRTSTYVETSKVLFYGPMGFGKSHEIFLLGHELQEAYRDKRVDGVLVRIVTIGDCSHLVSNALKVLKEALIVAFANDDLSCLYIKGLKTLEGIMEFITSCDEDLVFFLDQYQALDPVLADDPEEKARVQRAHELVETICAGRKEVRITSAGGREYRKEMWSAHAEPDAYAFEDCLDDEELRSYLRVFGTGCKSLEVQQLITDQLGGNPGMLSLWHDTWFSVTGKELPEPLFAEHHAALGARKGCILAGELCSGEMQEPLQQEHDPAMDTAPHDPPASLLSPFPFPSAPTPGQPQQIFPVQSVTATRNVPIPGGVHTTATTYSVSGKQVASAAPPSGSNSQQPSSQAGQTTVPQGRSGQGTAPQEQPGVTREHNTGPQTHPGSHQGQSAVRPVDGQPATNIGSTPVTGADKMDGGQGEGPADKGKDGKAGKQEAGVSSGGVQASGGPSRGAEGAGLSGAGLHPLLSRAAGDGPLSSPSSMQGLEPGPSKATLSAGDIETSDEYLDMLAWSKFLDSQPLHALRTDLRNSILAARSRGIGDEEFLRTAYLHMTLTDQPVSIGQCPDFINPRYFHLKGTEARPAFPLVRTELVRLLDAEGKGRFFCDDTRARAMLSAELSGERVPDVVGRAAERCVNGSIGFGGGFRKLLQTKCSTPIVYDFDNGEERALANVEYRTFYENDETERVVFFRSRSPYYQATDSILLHYKKTSRRQAVSLHILKTQASLQAHKDHSVSTAIAMDLKAIEPWCGLVRKERKNVTAEMVYIIPDDRIKPEERGVIEVQEVPKGGKWAELVNCAYRVKIVSFGYVDAALEVLDKWSTISKSK